MFFRALRSTTLALLGCPFFASIGCSGAIEGDPAAQTADPVNSSQSAMLHIRVLHADGSPVQWAWIEVDNQWGGKAFSGNAQNGEFAVSLPHGTYDVKSWNGGALLGSTHIALQSALDVIVGERPSHALRTEARHAGGSPVAWAWVRVEDAQGASVFEGNSPNGVNDMVLFEGRYRVEFFDGPKAIGVNDVDLAADRDVVVIEGGAAPTPPPSTPPANVFVRAAGTSLVLDGRSWHFKGLDIYNANSRGTCWTNLVDGGALDDSLNEIGPGQNAFRSWFFQKFATTNGARDWSAFDHTIAVAKAHGQKIIATLENQWQDCDDASFYKTEGWYQTGYKQTQGSDITPYRSWVEEVVTHYAKEPTILAWQLMNEAEASPAGSDSGGQGCSSTAAASLHAFTVDVSAIVKHADSNHLVSLGTLGSGQCGTSGAGEWQALHEIASIDLCEYHDYNAESLAATLQTRINECHAIGKPIFAGEVGINASTKRASELDAKLRAQFGAGDVGVLLWAWDYADKGATTGYNIGAGDDVLSILTHY